MQVGNIMQFYQLSVFLLNLWELKVCFMWLTNGEFKREPLRNFFISAAFKWLQLQ